MTTIPASGSWVVCPRPNPQARLRLFCFPYAGGGAALFRPWSRELPAEIEVCAIQPPGRENRIREPAFTRLDQLLQALLPAIQPYLNLPFAFFGHSLGALISFEVARALRQQHKPVHLFVSGRRAPQLPATEAPIHDLPDPEFMRELRRLNGTPEAVLQSAELMQLLLPLLRADFAIHETYGYSPGEPLDCPISAFGGLEDGEAGTEDMEAWSAQTCRQFKLRMLPGDHFFLHSQRAPLLQVLRQDLSQHLQSAV